MSQSREEKKAKAIARVRCVRLGGGLCEVCGLAPASQFAHRLARSRMGRWQASNGLYTCEPCHSAQRNGKGGEQLATALGQVLPSMVNSERPDPEKAPVQTVYGRVLLKDDGSVIPVGADMSIEEVI